MNKNCFCVCLLLRDKVADESFGRKSGRACVFPRHPTLLYSLFHLRLCLLVSLRGKSPPVLIILLFSCPADSHAHGSFKLNINFFPSTFPCLSFRSFSITLPLTLQWELTPAVRRKHVKGARTHTSSHTLRM
ncbi:hypothetical protein GOODEAATRI_031521 [Goodea atripinnis]|uniref:Uncharacterized protein n=1 Tax=Goodea atripinnis TaxID=208336 RepID=A0ABV0PTM6_9TELE